MYTCISPSPMRATCYLHPLPLALIILTISEPGPWEYHSIFYMPVNISVGSSLSLYQGHVFPTLSSFFYPENGARSSETRITIYFIINRGTKKHDEIRNTGPWAVHALKFTSRTDLLNKNLLSFGCCQPMIPSSKNSYIWPTDTTSKIKIPQHTLLRFTAITIIYCEMDSFIM